MSKMTKITIKTFYLKKNGFWKRLASLEQRFGRLVGSAGSAADTARRWAAQRGEPKALGTGPNGISSSPWAAAKLIKLQEK